MHHHADVPSPEHVQCHNSLGNAVVRYMLPEPSVYRASIETVAQERLATNYVRWHQLHPVLMMESNALSGQTGPSQFIDICMATDL